ncbi:MAG: hypothetical protein CMQ41_00780 [Gammaproteobacteria bacterium]|nr:hypothetical protein [Gammaproteobacteria bacterium]
MTTKFLQTVDYSNLIEIYNNGRFTDLAETIKRLTKKYPNDFRLFNLGGICSYKLEQHNKAIIQYRRAIELNPNFIDARINLGVVYKVLGNYDEAITEYRRAIDLNPQEFNALNNIGNLFLEKGDLKSAESWLKKALLLKPNSADALNNLGLVHKTKNQLEIAKKYFLKAIKANEKSFEPLVQLGIVFQSMDQCAEAIRCYDNALKIKPDLEMVLARKLNQHATICDWESIKNHSHRIPILGTNYSPVTPFSMLYLDDNPERHYQRANIYWNSKRKARHKVNFPRNKNPGSKPIRLGYFSSEFHTHPVMHLIARLFDLHDKTNFEIYAFSVGPKANDHLTNRLIKVFDKFYEVSSLSDYEIAKLARENKIDIAIDLSGHTKYGRPTIFDYRAAPIQINYLGYPGTMGMNEIDYLIADDTLVTPESRPFYSEKIIFMPSTYQVSDDTRPKYNRDIARMKYGFKNNDFILCSFNNLIKITETEFDIWLSLLKKVENAKLWLVTDNRDAKQNLRKYIVNNGINTERVLFAEYCSYHEYLERLTAADLFLDTFNFNAGATANDSLWCDLPVVTKIGKSYTSRMASSLLKELSLNKLIAQTGEEYEMLAMELSTNPESLKNIRQEIVESKEKSKLFDTKYFTKKLESAYVIVNQRFHEGYQPEDLNLLD